MKKRDNENKKKSLILASLHSVVICLLVLISFCFAWFSEVIHIPVLTKIQAATYEMCAEVSGNNNVTSGDCNSAESENGFCVEVESGKVYNVKLTKKTEAGSASQGYCIVSAGDDIHYTEPIIDAEGITFKILFTGNGFQKIEFFPYWGTYPGTVPVELVIPEEDIIKKGYSYVVSDGDICVSQGDNDQ